MNDGRFHILLRAPDLVEEALRAAVRELLRARRLGASTPDVRDVANIALAHVATHEARFRDPLERYEVCAAVVAATGEFMRSALGVRLATMPSGAIHPNTDDGWFDADVSDAAGSRHVVRLENGRHAQERLTLAATLRDSLGASVDVSKQRATIHLYSLRENRLRSYPASIAHRPRTPARHIRAA